VLLLIAGALWFALRKPSSDPVGPIAPASSSATFQTGQAGFDDGGGGYMWAGSGPRDRIVHVDFVKPFAEAPTVVVALSGVDAGSQNASSIRLNLSAQNVTPRGFDVNSRPGLTQNSGRRMSPGLPTSPREPRGRPRKQGRVVSRRHRPGVNIPAVDKHGVAVRNHPLLGSSGDLGV